VDTPFSALLTWIQIEILDIKAIVETIKSKDELILRKVHIEHEVKLAEANLEKARHGKFRLKSMFSKKEQTIQTLEEEIEQGQNKLEMIDFILYIVVSRAHAYELPRFKERKGAMYVESIRQFVSTLAADLEQRIKKYEAVSLMPTMRP
jgi:predicted nuclease with TOPRIM domain